MLAVTPACWQARLPATEPGFLAPRAFAAKASSGVVLEDSKK